MVYKIFEGVIYPVFYNCRIWFSSLVSACDAGDLILSMFVLVFIINSLFMPIRGFSMISGRPGSAMSSFKHQNKIASGAILRSAKNEAMYGGRSSKASSDIQVSSGGV